MRQEGQPGEVDSRIPEGPARRVDWARVIVGVCVRVKRYEFAEERQLVTKIEVTLAIAGIVAVTVSRSTISHITPGGVVAEDIGFEAVESNGVALPPED